MIDHTPAIEADTNPQPESEVKPCPATLSLTTPGSNAAPNVQSVGEPPIASAKDAPTPETDAAVKKMWNATTNHLSDVVMGYFSRDLEQRLSASRAECEREKQDFAKAMELSVGHCNRALKLERERDAALARVHQVWQPIETAPKDGSSIIGKFGSLVFRMNWQAYNLFGPQKPEGGCEVVGQRHGWSYVDKNSCCEGFPTHWIPMPGHRPSTMTTKPRNQDTPEDEQCTHDEHDHGVCLECGEDINDRLQDAAEYRKDAMEDR